VSGIDNPNPCLVVNDLFDALLKYRELIDVVEVLNSVLSSFTKSVDDNPTAAALLPKFPGAVIAFWHLTKRKGLNFYVSGIELLELSSPLNVIGQL
jgi:hypothetical protein